MIDLIQIVGDTEKTHDQLRKCFEGLQKGIDDVFVHVCLTSFEGKQSSFYELIEYVREKLNIGHWSEVPEFWREAYALLRLASVLTTLNSSQTTGSCDMKFILWQLDDALIMGHSEEMNNSITHLATMANAFLLEHLPSERFPRRYLDIDVVSPELISFVYPGEVISELTRVHQPSLKQFTDILRAGVPVIVTGSMTHWPACNEASEHYWSPAYWSKVAGYRTVPIEVGSAYTDESWGQRMITVNQFFKTFILNQRDDQPLGYLAQHQILLQIPELADDVDIPDYCFTGTSGTGPSETTVDSNIWVGPSNTVSPLHHDSDRSNVLCQLIGKKYVKLYTADQTEFIYPYTENMLCNTSEIDVASLQPDLEKFPKFKEARGYHGVLEPGEMLFIPPRAWHYIRSLTTSISMNFWWCVDDSFIPPWPESYKI
ncbi:hypothetical protein Aperf_G00000019581 [Anoplocephala perfoliata]